MSTITVDWEGVSVVETGCERSYLKTEAPLMKQVYPFGAINGEYLPAAQMFLQIEKWLRSENAKQKEHGEIESMLMKDGMELLRLLFQGFLDQQSKEEVMECEIVGADGTTRTHRRRHCSRQMETLFGTVSVDRLGYSAAGVASVYPLDGQLNLPPDKYSHGIRRLVAEEASKVSFDETVKSIGDMTGGEIPKRQAEQLVVQAAQDFEAFYEVGGVDEAEKTDDPLVITMDSKGIVMRKDDLREETKKRAEKQQGERKARLGKGEKRNRKRMATVASVYTIERQPRTAGEIMEANAKEKDPKIKPKARGKRVWASVERSPEQVTEEVFQEASRRELRQC